MVRTESAERQGALEAAVSSSIIDLRNGSIGKNDTFLRDGIIAGLKKTKTVVPGTTDEDLKYAHCKTIPTCASLALLSPPVAGGTLGIAPVEDASQGLPLTFFITCDAK